MDAIPPVQVGRVPSTLVPSGVHYSTVESQFYLLSIQATQWPYIVFSTIHIALPNHSVIVSLSPTDYYKTPKRPIYTMTIVYHSPVRIQESLIGSQYDDLVYIDEIPLRQFQPNY